MLDEQEITQIIFKLLKNGQNERGGADYKTLGPAINHFKDNSHKFSEEELERIGRTFEEENLRIQAQYPYPKARNDELTDAVLAERDNARRNRAVAQREIIYKILEEKGIPVPGRKPDETQAQKAARSHLDDLDIPSFLKNRPPREPTKIYEVPDSYWKQGKGARAEPQPNRNESAGQDGGLTMSQAIGKLGMELRNRLSAATGAHAAQRFLDRRPKIHEIEDRIWEIHDAQKEIHERFAKMHKKFDAETGKVVYFEAGMNKRAPTQAAQKFANTLESHYSHLAAEREALLSHHADLNEARKYRNGPLPPELPPLHTLTRRR